MDFALVWAAFLVLIGLAGNEARKTAITYTTGTIRTIASSGMAPSRTVKLRTTPSNITRSPSLSTQSSIFHSNSNTISSTQQKIRSNITPTSSTRVNPAVTTSVPPGFCAKYNETPCQDVLAKSWTQFNGSERYIDSKIGINGTAMFLRILLRESMNQINDPRCKWLIDVSLCQYTLSPCMSNGKLVSLCREDCESLTIECKIFLNRLIGSADLLTTLQGYDFQHLALPTNCSVYPSHKYGNDSCVYTGLFNHTMTSSSKTNQDILWIAIAAGGLFLILLFVIIVTCHMRRQKKKKEPKLELEEINLRKMSKKDSESTMKARLSEALQITSLSSKIAEMYDPSKLKQFSLDQIEYISDLGEGQFGLVFKGEAVGIDDRKDPSEATVVAVKTLKRDCNESSKEEFNQEVAFMSVLDHPNVVRLIAVATEEEPYCMIFEFMELGDLNQFLRKIKPLDETDETPEMELHLEDFLSICQQVAAGMSYLSSLHFVHRDLATRNCLVGTGLVVKIADFGMSRDIYSSDYYKVRGDAMLPVRWMPPEAVLHGKFTVASDVYSYGILMWEVFTYALQPYYGYTNEEVIGFAKQGVLLGQPEDCPGHIYKLMLDCWQRTSKRRPNFTTIIKRLVKEPPQMSDYSTPRPLSDMPEDQDEYMGINADDPIGKIPVPMSIKPSNSYVAPGSLVNCGFKSDKDECSTSGEKSATLPMIQSPKTEHEVLAERYSNIIVA